MNSPKRLGGRLANFKASILVFLLVIFSTYVFANTGPLKDTQNHLRKLDSQIQALQQHLKIAVNKHALLHNELASTEKKISISLQNLSVLQNSKKNTLNKIEALQQDNIKLQNQLKMQQLYLAQHVRSRYKIGAKQPLIWLFKIKNPQHTNIIFTYYLYIIRLHKQSITHLQMIQQQLQFNSQHLSEELKLKSNLEYRLHSDQLELNQNKIYQNTLLNTLKTEIQNNESELQEAKKNKDRLAKVLNSLLHRTLTKNTKSFAILRKKLPSPVQFLQSKKMNQGMTFFAEEGTPVTAVSSGTVVFSDWLKGYGLLMIIDHGQGFMTLYAHNESLYKNKGQFVHQNEKIASVGHSGGIKENGLYFEIRLKGKAIDPLAWLS